MMVKAVYGKKERYVSFLYESMRPSRLFGAGTDYQEKAKKMVDIWRKNGTFPADCLARLDQRIKIAATPQSTTPTYPPLSPVGPSMLAEKSTSGSAAPISGGVPSGQGKFISLLFLPFRVFVKTEKSRKGPQKKDHVPQSRPNSQDFKNNTPAGMALLTQTKERKKISCILSTTLLPDIWHASISLGLVV